MAYQRNISSLGTPNNNNQPSRLHYRSSTINHSMKSQQHPLSHYDLATEDNEEEENSITYLKEKYSTDHHHAYYSHPASNYHHVKPLVLFSFDLTNWSPILQYLFLIGGLILFMCLYGYYQELVIYGWFNRKLSIFSTFLHFLGCTFFAQIQRNVSTQTSIPSSLSSSNVSGGNTNGINPSNNANTNVTIPNFASQSIWRRGMYYFYWYMQRWSNITMGTASTRTALGYYLLLVFSKTAAQGLSNLSMTEINYPAKVLFKSANPIITILLGLCWFRKTYPLRDYIVVGLLILGLYVFITGDKNHRPECTPLGIFYVVLSMFGSAGVPMIQEYCITTYNAPIEDLLYYCFLGSTIVSLLLAILNGEFLEGILFLINSGSVHTWTVFIAFCTFGFIGANFSTAITAHYGSLVNGLSNTFRKAVTIVVSFIMFPERNELTIRKVYGATIFFIGLLVSIFTSEGKHKAGVIKVKAEDQTELPIVIDDIENPLNDRYVSPEPDLERQLESEDPLERSVLNLNEMATETLVIPSTSTGTTSISSQFPSDESSNFRPKTPTTVHAPSPIVQSYNQYGFEEEKSPLSPSRRQSNLSSATIPPPITKSEIDTFIPERTDPSFQRQFLDPPTHTMKESYRIRKDAENSSVYNAVYNNVSSFYQNLSIFGTSDKEKEKELLRYNQQSKQRGTTSLLYSGSENDEDESQHNSLNKHHFTV